jgi:2-oxoisovalerate dehydrogenase E1 component
MPVIQFAMTVPKELPSNFNWPSCLPMTGDGSARYPGDDYVLPFGQARIVREGTDLTVVSWSAMVHRCSEAAEAFGDRVELIDLRTISPWDRETVLESVRKTGRCLIVHEDNMTAGFGAEIAGVLAQEAFWHLDAPVRRLAPMDIPVPYHTVLLEAVVPGVERIQSEMDALLAV